MSYCHIAACVCARARVCVCVLAHMSFIICFSAAPLSANRIFFCVTTSMKGRTAYTYTHTHTHTNRHGRRLVHIVHVYMEERPMLDCGSLLAWHCGVLHVRTGLPVCACVCVCVSPCFTFHVRLKSIGECQHTALPSLSG